MESVLITQHYIAPIMDLEVMEEVLSQNMLFKIRDTINGEIMRRDLQAEFLIERKLRKKRDDLRND